MIHNDVSLQANQRVEEFKVQLKSLKKKLKEAEKRAILAERTVKLLLKEVDTKEGIISLFYFVITSIKLERKFEHIIDVDERCLVLQTSSERRRKSTRLFATTWMPRSPRWRVIEIV